MIHPLVLHCNGHIGYDGIIHHHVEYRRGYKYALSCTPFDWEGWSMEAILSWNQLLAVPEGLKDPTHLRTRAVSLQCY